MNGYANGENLNVILQKNEPAPFEGFLVPHDALFNYEACCSQKDHLEARIIDIGKSYKSDNSDVVTFGIIGLALGFALGATAVGLAQK
jgi:hypothetical protein